MLMVVVYSIVVMLAAWAGGLLPLGRDWRGPHLRMVISFAAGVLLGAAFLHMLPEAIGELGGTAGGVMLVGFLALFVIEKFMMVHACHSEHCESEMHVAGLATFVGLSIHSLGDGLALGSAALVGQTGNLDLGFLVLIAIVAHKMPASLSLMAVLLAAGYSRSRTAALIVFFSLMAPLGAVAVVLLARTISGPVLAILLALSAGTFVHIAADDLLPAAHQVEVMRAATLLTFLLGIAFMWSTTLMH
jgi:zinc and cadmium transporter